MAQNNSEVEIKIDRLELIDALKARLPELEAKDKELAAKHSEAEKAWHAEFQSELRLWLKLNRTDLKKALTKSPYQWGKEAPSCPIAQHPRCEDLIAVLERDTAPWYKITAADWRYVLAYGPLRNITVCD